MIKIGKGTTNKYAVPGRWPLRKVWKWYDNQPWMCGCNYIPATAVNDTEIWQKGDFDPETIDKELALAKEIGLNCIRVFMQYLVWEDDPAYYISKMEKFSDISDKHDIKIMWVLFDDCVFPAVGKNTKNPYLGKQKDPIPGVFFPDWTPSPGWSRVRDPSKWPKLKYYVQEIISHFKNDPRVLLWDLYNEPNPKLWNRKTPLLKEIFKWAREINPPQPLTVCFHKQNSILNGIVRANSDIISFHNYFRPFFLRYHINRLRRQQRPQICTEWMHRGLGSRVKTCLPIFYKERVGCFHWGHVNGRSQANFSWFNVRPNIKPPKRWQHDLFYSNYKPYDQKEIDLFRKLTGKLG